MINDQDQDSRFGNNSVFNCRMCGECCRGAGGIVLSQKDIERLAGHLDLSISTFLQQYAEHKNGKYRLKVGLDEYCVFFRQGCNVHDAKPDICRAWPFFKGNIVDPYSFAMAKEYCPGIHPEASHEAFAAEGMAFLREEGLLCDDHDGGASALCIEKQGD